MILYDLIIYPMTIFVIGKLIYSFGQKCPVSNIFIGRAISKITISLMKMSGPTEKPTESCRLLNGDKILEITYKYGTSVYVLCVPYRSGLSKRGLKVKLTPNEITENNPERYITQQSGIPYLITPNDLGGVVEILNMENKVVNTFKGNDLIHCYADKYSKYIEK